MSDPSLVAEYRREFGNSFHPLKLWRDRRTILAEPALAARPNPPLANAPVRFALSLSLVPLLFVGWLMSALVDVAYPDYERPAINQDLLTPVIDLLAAELPDVDAAAVTPLAESVKTKQMPPAARALLDEAFDPLMFRARYEPSELRDKMVVWLGALRASELTREHQIVLKAKVLRGTKEIARLDRRTDTLMRSFLEGGLGMQIVSVLAALLGAWLFGQMLRGDSRFVHAERADRFYLYYLTCRMFWFLPASALAYGVVSFASAIGNTKLMGYAQWLQMLVGGGALLYLLLHVREMARALCDASPAPRGAAYAVGWRLLIAQGVAMMAVILTTMLFFAAALALYVMLN